MRSPNSICLNRWSPPRGAGYARTPPRCRPRFSRAGADGHKDSQVLAQRPGRSGGVVGHDGRGVDLESGADAERRALNDGWRSSRHARWAVLRCARASLANEQSSAGAGRAGAAGEAVDGGAAGRALGAEDWEPGRFGVSKAGGGRRENQTGRARAGVVDGRRAGPEPADGEQVRLCRVVCGYRERGEGRGLPMRRNPRSRPTPSRICPQCPRHGPMSRTSGCRP